MYLHLAFKVTFVHFKQIQVAIGFYLSESRPNARTTTNFYLMINFFILVGVST